MNKYVIIVFLSLFSFKVIAQRDTVIFNHQWQFAIDKEGIGFSNQWFKKGFAKSTELNLPHTWNIEDSNQRHYGWGWYQKKFMVPLTWKGKSVRIRFGAINHTSVIYINGNKIEENIGDGFSQFFVDLSDKLDYGVINTITIAVNNDYGKNKVPFGSSFDWPNDGGIIRKVSLIVTDRPYANYIHARPILNLIDSSGTLKLKLGLDDIPNKNIELLVSVSEENQVSKNLVFQNVYKPLWINKDAIVEFNLPKVNPWHFDFPNLYRVDVTVMKRGKASDKVSTVIGFREIKFLEGKTYLNGERIKLMGVEWTAGSNPDYGFAETDSIILSQCKLMKDVNTIFTRQHFQQDELFYDYCDRQGILVQQELPLWGPETPANDTIRMIAIKQLERMISNYYNHTSIFSWGVGNELRGRDLHMKKLISDLLDKVKLLDSSRYVAYVSNTLTSSFYNNPSFTPDAADAGDYLMMNEYGGSWWDIPVGKIHAYLDSVHLSYPTKPFFISEFGLCEPNFKGGDQRRIEDLIYHMAIYESKPYIEGAIYFDLTDYRTHYPGTNENDKYRRRIHGVYDMYGNPKPSMAVLRELSSPVEISQVRVSKKGKLSITLFGSIGLPQHTVKGYKLYVSDKAENYTSTKFYNLPDISPGQRINIEVEDMSNGRPVVTIVRPTGHVVTQKSF